MKIAEVLPEGFEMLRISKTIQAGRAELPSSGPIRIVQDAVDGVQKKFHFFKDGLFFVTEKEISGGVERVIDFGFHDIGSEENLNARKREYTFVELALPENCGLRKRIFSGASSFSPSIDKERKMVMTVSFGDLERIILLPNGVFYESEIVDGVEQRGPTGFYVPGMWEVCMDSLFLVEILPEKEQV